MLESLWATQCRVFEGFRQFLLYFRFIKGEPGLEFSEDFR